MREIFDDGIGSNSLDDSLGTVKVVGKFAFFRVTKRANVEAEADLADAVQCVAHEEVLNVQRLVLWLLREKLEDHLCSVVEHLSHFFDGGGFEHGASSLTMELPGFAVTVENTFAEQFLKGWVLRKPNVVLEIVLEDMLNASRVIDEDSVTAEVGKVDDVSVFLEPFHEEANAIIAVCHYGKVIADNWEARRSRNVKAFRCVDVEDAKDE